MELVTAIPSLRRPSRSGDQRKSEHAWPRLLRPVREWFGLASKAAAESKTADPRQVRRPRQDLLGRGESLLRQCLRDNQPMSLAVFDVGAIAQLESASNANTAREIAGRIAAHLRCLATSSGVAGWTSPSTFTLLVPGVGCDKVTAAATALLGSDGAMRFTHGAEEIVVAPEFGVRAVGSTDSLRPIHKSLCDDIAADLQKKHRRQQELEWQCEWDRGCRTVARGAEATIPMALRPSGQRGEQQLELAATDGGPIVGSQPPHRAQ
jgi:hypothetical protein